MTIVARSRPCSLVIQPRQVPASSLMSPIDFSSATPSSGDSASATARSSASCIVMADLLLLYGGRLHESNLPAESVGARVRSHEPLASRAAYPAQIADRFTQRKTRP